MAFIKLNDDAGTRVNLSRIVSYTVNVSSTNATFKLATNNSGSTVDFTVQYTGAIADEQIVTDNAFLEQATELHFAPVAVDAT